MTKFEQDVMKQLGELNAGMQAIKESLANDYQHLHGNGKPGLIERVKELEDWRASMSRHYGAVVAVIAFAINAGIALYALWKKH